MKTYDPLEKPMADLIHGDITSPDAYPSMSDYYYTIIRKDIVGFLPLALKEIEFPPVQREKPKKKAEQIIQTNNDKVITSEFKKFMERKDKPLANSYIELRLLALYILYKENKNEEVAYDIAASVLKFNFDIQDICPFAMIDFKTFRDAIPFNWKIAFSKYYEMIQNPSYLSVFPRSDHRVFYKSQVQTIDYLAEHNTCLIINRASLGSGKTSTAVKIAYDCIRTDKTVVFCCSNINVRTSIGKLAFASGVPFAIVSSEQNGKLVETKSIPEQRTVLIITDYRALYQVLESNPESASKYILFIDEPTIGADHPNDPRIEAFLRVFKEQCPAQTLLVSGTLPSYEEFPELYEIYHDRFPTGKIVEITDQTSKISSNLQMKNAKYWVPEFNLDTREDLVRVLEKLQEYRFMTRFHNVRHLLYLDSLGLSFSIFDFRNPDNWRQVSIAKIIERKLFEVQNPARYTIEADVAVFPDLKNLFTTAAIDFFGGCFVASTTPFEDAKKLAEASFGPGQTWDSLYRSMIIKQSAVSRPEREFKSERLAAEQLRERQEMETVAKWNFPPSLQINSAAHLRKYHPEIQKARNVFIAPLNFDDIPFGSASIEYLVLLAMGIGIFKEDLPKGYLSIVSLLLTKGRIPFCFADDSIAYGTNAPFNHLIIIDPEIVRQHSILTSIQLITRVGRTGKIGTIRLTSDDLVTKFVILLDGRVENIEHDNIRDMIDTLWG